MKASKANAQTDRVDNGEKMGYVGGYKPKLFGALGSDKYKVVMQGNSSFYEKKRGDMSNLRQEIAQKRYQSRDKI